MKAALDLLWDPHVGESNKVYCLHVVNLSLMLRNDLFVESFFREMNRMLMELLTGRWSGESGQGFKPGRVFGAIKANGDERKAEEFHRLLSQCVYVWRDDLGGLEPVASARTWRRPRLPV